MSETRSLTGSKLLGTNLPGNLILSACLLEFLDRFSDDGDGSWSWEGEWLSWLSWEWSSWDESWSSISWEGWLSWLGGDVDNSVMNVNDLSVDLLNNSSQNNDLLLEEWLLVNWS